MTPQAESFGPRLDNPTAIDRDAIVRILDRGAQPTVQFSKPASSEMLRAVDGLCQEFGDRLEVRFEPPGADVIGVAMLTPHHRAFSANLATLRHTQKAFQGRTLPSRERFGEVLTQRLQLNRYGLGQPVAPRSFEELVPFLV